MGDAVFDVVTKWMSNGRLEREDDRPARANRIELCEFHFFDTLPDVSSQYIHSVVLGTFSPVPLFSNCSHVLCHTLEQGIQPLVLLSQGKITYNMRWHWETVVIVVPQKQGI